MIAPTSSLTELLDEQDLDRWLEGSTERPVLLFKHSLTCGVSTWALREVEAAIEELGDDVGAVMVPIQPRRELSREIAQRTGIRHESPQVLVFHDGRPVWNASHWKLERASVVEAVRGVTGSTP